MWVSNTDLATSANPLPHRWDILSLTSDFRGDKYASLNFIKSHRVEVESRLRHTDFYSNLLHLPEKLHGPRGSHNPVASHYL